MSNHQRHGRKEMLPSEKLKELIKNVDDRYKLDDKDGYVCYINTQ